MDRLSQKVIERLGWYVYLYVNPFDNTVFYVGKGKGNRLLAHLREEGESAKAKVIRGIQALGREPRIEVLMHGLETETEALRMESAVIGLLGSPPLTNEIRGYDAGIVGRIPLERLVALYTAEPVDVLEPSVLIRINRLYRYDMSDTELYEATRGVWKVGERRLKARLALAVYKGVVREVYRIDQPWLPAGTTQYLTRIQDKVRVPGRWEFTGARAEDGIRARYIDRSVGHYFTHGSQNPVVYVNC